ncbi:hypothetical protein SASPL_130524 [Salvia splendens]|uniref:t-SNARE coiled-coil homology domain-containing protein n=1 Tax=Salvia splendens TaxID=180675 RepID=A0A8X8ZJR1_SALSN|nr:hypothetical protein SASPL_130524 [Salvia splendens]
MVSEALAEIEGQIQDIFRALSNGFQKLEKIKDSTRRSRQLEELTDKMRECKRCQIVDGGDPLSECALLERYMPGFDASSNMLVSLIESYPGLIKDYDRELKDSDYKNDPSTNKILNEKKQSMIKELNSYVALKKQYSSSLEHKRVDLFEGPGEGFAEDNVLLASNMTNQQLMDHGNNMMDETDQAIDRAQKVVHETINVGTETSAALKAQTEQMSRIVNELDSIHFSIKKASKLVKEIGRQVATDRCIMALLFLIVVGVLAVIIVKIVNPNNKDIRDIPGLAPPAPARKLLWISD